MADEKLNTGLRRIFPRPPASPPHPNRPQHHRLAGTDRACTSPGWKMWFIMYVMFNSDLKRIVVRGCE